MAHSESVQAELLSDKALVNVIVTVRDSDGGKGVGEAWWGIADGRWHGAELHRPSWRW